MDAEQVAGILTACEQALASEERVDLGQLGFWKAVQAVKRHPDWVNRFGSRIAAIDREAFERAVRMRFPLRLGLGALSLGTVVGIGLILAAFWSPQRRRDLFLIVGTGMLLGTTHDLAHFLVGRALGIRFCAVFLGGKGLIEPGLKIDYSSYLRTPPRQRARMHAAGAVTTKAVAFVAVIVALLARSSAWAVASLGGIALSAAMADVFLSTRYSDWKRYRREMRVARELEASHPG